MQQESTTRQVEAEYLPLLQSLSDELALATAAIARNDLDALERHVESQQKLCAQLQNLALPSSGSQAGDAVRANMAELLRTLSRNTGIYSKVIDFSGRSQRALFSLCKAYKKSCTRAAGPESTPRTLHCEA